MNFLRGLKKYWEIRAMRFEWRGVLFLSFIGLAEAREPICVEGTLLKAELQCAMVAPERRIKVSINPRMLLLPDSLVRVSEKYPVFFWIKDNADWKSLVGKHVRIVGVAQEFFSGEFLIEVESAQECESIAQKLEFSEELTEEEIDYWEEQIPMMANAGFQQTGLRVLLKGFDVVQSHDNALWTIHPDGTETFIKDLPPPIWVGTGRIFHIDP